MNIYHVQSDSMSMPRVCGVQSLVAVCQTEYQIYALYYCVILDQVAVAKV